MNKIQKSKHVYGVFEKISGEYDQANNRISLGLQKKWKEMLIQKVVEESPKDSKILDVCCGTGDISIGIAEKRRDLTLVGLDFSPAMLKEAERKSKELPQIIWKKGDAVALPFPENHFSAACISFGLRNTPDYEKVLSEMKRVVKEQGTIYCLDSFVPENSWIKPFYQMYFKYIMPFLGGGKEHYQEYLWLYESTQEFLSRKELLALFDKIGFREIKNWRKLFGACVLIQGKK